MRLWITTSGLGTPVPTFSTSLEGTAQIITQSELILVSTVSILVSDLFWAPHGIRRPGETTAQIRGTHQEMRLRHVVGWMVEQSPSPDYLTD